MRVCWRLDGGELSGEQRRQRAQLLPAVRLHLGGRHRLGRKRQRVIGAVGVHDLGRRGEAAHPVEAREGIEGEIGGEKTTSLTALNSIVSGWFPAKSCWIFHSTLCTLEGHFITFRICNLARNMLHGKLGNNFARLL